ncbi:Vacuolar protein sorting-associated protein 13 [Dioscorea alata]|uniref:Vacuolar protein sorting-associated protein 13 n=1 Tax=Dioscorea alata TaxID=55571 RepID=A0ACB7W6A4_DIOAL|nr:Vacuolar protein sorting-associated protein 13 [Dioscorea alata]
MFEAHVLFLLRKYLGEYVEGLSNEALRISVWKGDVVLKDLKLKAEALNNLKLPVTVKAGFVGTITLKVPWKSLGKEPVVVLIDRVFLLAHPAPDGQSLKDEDRERLFEAKLQQIEEAELAIIEARRTKAGAPPVGNSWLGSLIATIIGNLKVSISNVHIRYEDSISNPGHPFCCGVTLSKLAAVTTDELGNETFDASGALDKLRKSVQLQRLAAYHDSDSTPWKPNKKWEDLNPTEWAEIFQDGIDELRNGRDSIWAMNRRYLVSPINGVLIYHRLGKQERHNADIPFERALLVLSDVSLTVSEEQYYDAIKLLETFSRYKTRVEVSHLRPVVRVSEDPNAWWHYAMLAGLQQKKMCYWFSWERIKHLCDLRRRYVLLYSSYLQQSSNFDFSELRQIEKVLDSKVIILWRLLAHAKVESVKSKEASRRKGTFKKSWWSFGWRNPSGDASAVGDTTESELDGEERLTKEEWHAINKILSYQVDEDTTLLGKDMQHMMLFLVDVSVNQAAARIIDINQTEIVCGRFEQLHVTTKLYHKSIHCDVSLKFYGLMSPEGPLARSVSSEKKNNALTASFVHAPIGENVDWRLSAIIAPCHVTVLMESYEKFIEFVKRSTAVSPTVAWETAAALQTKIEKVTRRAQEQIQMVLEDQSRFALDIDFDAPKMLVPITASGSTTKISHFLMDFGHFTVCTREDQGGEQRHSLYSRFYISGRDMAALFIDSGISDGNYARVLECGNQSSSSPTATADNQCYSLLDRCGMSVIIDQIRIPHPSYPSTRINVQVPNLGIHFSPAIYGKIMELLNIFYQSAEISDDNTFLQTGHMPWDPPDLASDARILVWRGIGNSLAEWQPCHLILSGLYLYVLESALSQNYQRCSSMAGRQVFEVSPTSVGGSLFSIAVSFRGIEIQKALESSNTLIIEFQDEDERSAWLRALVQATYKASAHPTIDVLGEPVDGLSKPGGPQFDNLGKADLVINGTLVELKMSIYGRVNGGNGKAQETLLLEFLAGGGKVNLVQFGGNLSVKAKLHSLKIKDGLQVHRAAGQQYLACSVQQEHERCHSPGGSELNDKDMQKLFVEEDDSFTDALPDFMLIDQSFYSQNPDVLSYSTSARSSDQYGGICDLDEISRDQLKGKNDEVFYEAWDNNVSDFVVVTFVTGSPDSPLYDGIDTQMCISMSALEFFCNRPTLVALIDFGFDLSLVSSEISSKNDVEAQELASKDTEKKEENGRVLVKGLLGYGKTRVVFNLRMDVDSVCIYLNKEDGSQLAMFVQESFLLDLKVHPSSITIEGTLGNMRLRDMSLEPDHCWSWLCDIRNQGMESLIKFTFQSYSVEDDDYQGYDYSLTGRLSAVRIVFLYRFVQEITSYFMELASPHTEEAIKFVDKVGGIEWLIQKYEIQGASAVKLDLSLDTPIIIVPKNSMSKDCMQLDLGRLQISNTFSWYGSRENDPSAVHLDLLHAEIHGINMAVGVDGIIGKPMIHDGRGLHIYVRRSLRDVFRKVPTLSIDIQVEFLHGIMSDKEYKVILDCAYMNLSEQPNLPPSFRGNIVGMKDSIRMIADKVNLNSQIALSRTVAVMAVEVNYALLELCNSRDEQSPLAQIALEGLWVSYRTTSLFEMDLYVTIPKFSVLDIRPDTKPEMRLMLGSYADVSKPDKSENFAFHGAFLAACRNDESSYDVESITKDASNLTMLIMDYRWRSSFQSFVIRIQQPRVLVVLDFILAVAEYLFPALGTITGREETLDPKNDPLTNCDNIILSGSVYLQKDDIVYLSPRRQLIVDGYGMEEFTYDGCGGTISLSEEFDLNGQSSSGIIILIGRGKKLRFRNVKIKNGALLRKYTYLSNNSSYSVSTEDGVEVSLSDTCASDNCKGGIIHLQGFGKKQRSSETVSHSPPSEVSSFTFEAQVVSPEFTFYNSSKFNSDDSLHIEKLLRAKLDFSLMFASKASDTWIRSIVKDLTVEAGSGLVVLEPVDVSGGYTSVKDKTNISLVSTDIYTHLSLGVISLILQLQNQALAALHSGNANPLASCINFQRIWVSHEGQQSGYSLTFWRPQAPSNYVILGDCVTSRPIPPSQVVVAVNNIYGRVRKPLGYKLIGSFSCFQENKGEDQVNADSDCSLWMPVPPPGYVAVGCIAHVGKGPPPNHIVYCLRSDLVTSANLSDCIYCVPSNSRILSGFSIWRVDNIIGTFCAHASMHCPTKDNGFDLHQILLRNPNWNIPHFKSNSDVSVENDRQSQQDGDQNSNSSGWDIIRSLSKTSNCFMSTPHFERVWWDKGCDSRPPISIWRPLPRPGFAALGDCVTEGLEPPSLGLVFKCDNSVISAKPVQFTKVAHIVGRGIDEAFFWYPIPPPGYASLGCVVTRTDQVPKEDSFCCPRMDLVNQANVSDEPVSRSPSSKTPNCWSIWAVDNQAYTFLARPDLRKPSSRLAYNITDCVKPKARENITAEIKVGCFSVNILDSLCGTMTPVFDTTITNINLVTHGRFESMNAVLVCSIAASTFNRQLEAWEPLVEPFDGIFKFETYDTNGQSPNKIGKRIRVAATTIVNLNLSAASLEVLTETMVSWNKQNDLEQKLLRRNEEAAENFSIVDLAFSALEDDLQKVIVENNLGCDIFIKTVEQISETLDVLQNNTQMTLLMPPPTFSDRLNTVSKSREIRYYVAIEIIESKGLPLLDDGNSHEYFCALRLLIESKGPDQYKLSPQSARTRCVKPNVSKNSDQEEGHAKWNELFIFEVPEQGSANLEVEVTNLASKAGKGEVIGALSIPIGNGAHTLKRASSIRMLQQTANAQRFSLYPLRRKDQDGSGEDRVNCGNLVVSTTYFERGSCLNSQRKTESTMSSDRDVGFWVGLCPEGPWESIDSLLPLAVIPQSIDKNPFALEVTMQNSKKHAILRALAIVMNDADVKFEISLCPASMLSSSIVNMENSNFSTVTEEVFENQRYQPISGWGNNSSNSHSSDPGRFSTRNFSYSSKDFFEPSLPDGWRWISPWNIERSEFVDSDGWAYGPDFQSLKWPPTSSRSSSKSVPGFVRRRRWIRTRRQLPEKRVSSAHNVIAIVNPGSSSVLPWRSMARDMDMCLLVRPYGENSQEPYTWGQSVTLNSSKNRSLNQQASFSKQSTMQHENLSSQNSPLRLNQLEKNDMLLCCRPSGSAPPYFWLGISVDASVLHTELNTPIYDWKISINAAIRLENKLPCQSEYTIWEKTTEGAMLKRQHGIIPSCRTAFIYSADLRRPIYLTLFVQGGWVLEKEAVLIMDLISLGHASSFWMVQKPSNRRLRVSVEHDMGGTDAAPKTVRFFVPYWIQNDSCVPIIYRLVEVEPLDNSEADSLLISKAVKSAKVALKQTSRSIDRKHSLLRRNIQILENIDESYQDFVMFSPQDYMNRSGILPFPSRGDTFLSTRVGISVAVRHSDNYCPGISLFELERKERVNVKAFASDGSYYKLSAQLNMASDRTKVVRFIQQSLFLNRTGNSISLSQDGTQHVDRLHAVDPPKLFKWQSSARNEKLKLCVDGYKWSTPFSIESNGLMCVCMENEKENSQMYIKVEVRSGTKSSPDEVIFRLASSSSPYRIENRLLFLPIRFRQVNGTDNSWHSLPPNASASFFWEDLGRQRLLEVLVDGTDSTKSEKYNLDELVDHQPMQTYNGPIRPLHFTVLKEGKVNIARICDWMPDNDSVALVHGGISLPVFQPSNSDYGMSPSASDSECHVTFELAELGLSVIDHMPEEIMYLSMQNLSVSYSSGLGLGISRFKLRMQGIQVDNQLPFTPMPVLFRPQRVGDDMEYILKFSLTMQTNGSLDLSVYPYLGLQVPENCAILVNIHEPIIWRLHEMFQQVKSCRIFGSPTNAVSVDPTIQIGLLNISEIRFKLSMTMSPTQRPKGVLGFWSSLMTALGNTEHMPVRIAPRFHETICMRQSALISSAVSSIQKDLLSQPLQLLSGVDILGNASSALGHMSKGMAALSMDKKFIQSRQKQDNKGVEDIGDVIREGGGALAKGFFRGVTGILTKPLEGAKSSGVEGFVQGVGKGIIGAAAQPVSGVLDLLSKTTEGANAVKMKIASAITSEDQLLRKRLPRVIGGDNLLRPYDEFKATGQAILQLAESGAFFGQVDLFKVRGKFAFSDAYEDHFLLPKGKVLLVTHRRVILLQQPANIMAQRKFNPARDACTILWDVVWEDLVTMELTRGKKDQPGSLPSHLIIYLHSRSIESKESTRVIKCTRGSQQACDIYASIEQALNTYGPNASRLGHKKKVVRPYTPSTTAVSPEIFPREAFGIWGAQASSGSLPVNSGLGSVVAQSQPRD